MRKNKVVTSVIIFLIIYGMLVKYGIYVSAVVAIFIAVRMMR